MEARRDKNDPASDRPDSDEVLPASETRYRRLFETAQDGILLLDGHTGLITDVNPFLVKLLDYPREEFIGKTLWDFGPFKNIEATKTALHELQEKEYIRYDDLPLEARNGRSLNVEFVSNVYQVNGARVIQCNIRDISARKLSELALRASQAQLSAIVTSAMDGIITVDREQRIVLFNRAAEKMFGYTALEMTGQPLECLLPERFRQSHSRLVDGFAKTDTTTRRIGELNHLSALRANGQEFPIEASISGASVSGERFLTAIIRDVTERELAEVALRRGEAELKEAQRVARVGSWTLEARTGQVTWSVELYRMLGLDPSLPAPDYSEQQRIFTPESWARLTAEVDKTTRTGAPYELELEMLRPDGRKGWMLARGEAVRDANTDIPGLRGIAMDITDRKRNEEELRKAEERFSKAFRSSPLASAISTQSEGRYLFVNDAFLAMLKYEPRSVIGHTAAEVGFWTVPSHRMEMLQQLEKDGRVRGFRTECKTSTGEIRQVEVSAEVIDLDGQNCVLAITHDITESQRLEAQFLQAQKMEAVGRLAGGIAHDFNNLLGVIIGYSDLALGAVAPENPATKHLQQVKTASTRAVSLTRQLLAFSRQQVVFPKFLDLNELVTNVIDMLVRMVGEDVAVSFRPTTPIDCIKADPSQIEQILMNLVVNARDAMPGGGKILIETGHAEIDEHYVSQHPGSQSGPHVVLSLSDTGCGMDENIKSRIFEPFFTTKGVGKGTGLGLSTVYGIVKQNGGCVFVYSEVGKGTTFKIYFPSVAESADHPAHSREEATFPGGSETILVAEDDQALRELAISLLEGAGYRVIEATDAETALSILQHYEPEIDLLLTDVIMPGKSGMDLLALARQARPNLRSLFMSGYAADLVAQRGGLPSESAFLEKPFSRSSLLTKVYSALHLDSAKLRSQ
jgi:two-component system cell cycle sensor histidine kinase/response regulator CckA